MQSISARNHCHFVACLNLKEMPTDSAVRTFELSDLISRVQLRTAVNMLISSSHLKVENIY